MASDRPRSKPPAAAPSGCPTRPRAGWNCPRPPSPTEARPLRAIPVPEEFVPLAPRDWAPNRKVWSASGLCHTPLYFQDAALERYGQTAEQYVGPLGRFLSYPLDDPTQSNQRNQIAQPFFSMGLFAAQIALLPYNMLVDPPWEAEYDLGYYRPGDRVPTDVYYFPLHGVGPPFRGSELLTRATGLDDIPRPPAEDLTVLPRGGSPYPPRKGHAPPSHPHLPSPSLPDTKMACGE
jgi:hypothetical protein